MKKFYLLSALALSAMLGVTSCSSDDAPQVAADGETSFTVQLPADLASRAFGDGQSATTLTYAVYEHDSADPITFSDGKNFGTAQFTNLKATVSMNLPRGKSYDIIFWAQNPAAPYTFSAENRNVTVDYEAGYTEENDAFSYTLKNFSIVGATSTTVTLKRPFAQLNIGTTDYDIAKVLGLDVKQTAVTVDNVYTQFNFMDGEQGEVAGNATTATFALADIPDATEKFPVTDPANIKYLSMNYLLVPANKMTTSVTFSCDDKDYTPYVFENVPFQRNYRTNIYGQLLTAPAEFKVVIDPSFEEPDYNVTEVSVKNYKELTAALAQDYVTIHVTKDIGAEDLNNVPGDFTVSGRRVIIDLGGHTIHSMNGSFIVKGSCEEFSLSNGSLITARRVEKSAIYVNETGTKKVTIDNVNLDHFTWDGIQITSPTLEEININKCNFPGNARGWTLTCQRYIHIEFRKDGTYMVPMSDCKVNITNNTFPLPRYIREEAVGVYQVNPAGITFSGNTLTNYTGDAAGKWAGKPYQLFNFWNLNAEGQWVNWGAENNYAFIKAGLTLK